MKNCSFWTEYSNFWWKTHVSEQNTAISDEKHAFLNRIQQFMMKNARFWTEYSDFWWKTCVSEQNTAISDEKHAFLNRIRQFLTKNMRFWAEYGNFWWKTCVSKQKMKIYDEKRAFLLPSFGGAGGGSRFFSLPLGGLGEAPLSSPSFGKAEVGS